MKLCTFEGKQHLVETQSIASEVAKRSIEQICTNISEHVIDVSGGNIKVTWMTLYLKLGKNGKVYVLFCSKIKVRDYFKRADRDDEQKVISPRLALKQEEELSNFFQFYRKVRLNKGNISVLDYSDKQGQKYCSKCVSKYRYFLIYLEKGPIYEIQLKHLLNAYIRGYLKPNTNMDSKLVRNYLKFETDITSDKEYLNINLPLIFQVLWEKVNQATILKLANNNSWMELTTFLCESCYLQATTYLIDESNPTFSFKKALNKRLKMKKKDLSWLVNFIKTKVIPKIKMILLISKIAKEQKSKKASPEKKRIQRMIKMRKTRILKSIVPKFKPLLKSEKEGEKDKLPQLNSKEKKFQGDALFPPSPDKQPRKSFLQKMKDKRDNNRKITFKQDDSREFGTKFERRRKLKIKTYMSPE